MPLYYGKLAVKGREIAVTYPSAFCPDSVLLLVFDQSQTKLTEHLLGTLPSFSGEMPDHSLSRSRRPPRQLQNKRSEWGQIA